MFSLQRILPKSLKKHVSPNEHETETRADKHNSAVERHQKREIDDSLQFSEVGTHPSVL